MKTIFLKSNILLLACFIIGNLISQELDCFKLQSTKINIIEINQKFLEQESTIPLTIKTTITGLSISGKINLKGDNSLVRVILLDDKKNEYLVYEAYSMIVSNRSFEFDNICEETSLLDNINPAYLKVITNNAEFEIKSINISGNHSMKIEKNIFLTIKRQTKEAQVQEKVDRINEYNENNNIYWRADVTELSMLPFRELKEYFNNEDHFLSNGYEFYTSGVFVAGQLDNKRSNLVELSDYPSSFDWRDRHGVNWLTSRKRQVGQTCWAYAPTAVIEILTNLYFNQKIDLDLSEQDVISCSNARTPSGTGYTSVAMQYIKKHGIVDESCFPTIDAFLDCPPEKCVNLLEQIRISDYHTINSYNYSTDEQFFDEVKNKLIFKGPIISGHYSVAHVMALIGYVIVQAGDTIRYVNVGSGNDLPSYSIIPLGDPLIGKTCWIYKNSEREDYHRKIVYMDKSKMSTPYYMSTPITSLNYTESDRICEDKDGDGYYYWGIGPKPSTCPDCAPDEPDGDDSNPYLGPMDEYGNCRTVSPKSITDYVTTTTVWTTHKDLCGNLSIQSGGNLTIKSTVKLQPTRSIYVYNGANLVIDGGCIDNVNIYVYSGGNLLIKNNGKLILSPKGNLTINKGAIFNHQYGAIDRK